MIVKLDNREFKIIRTVIGGVFGKDIQTGEELFISDFELSKKAIKNFKK